MSTIDTTNWTVYPFEVEGVKFESRVKPDSLLGYRIALVPPAIFSQMNIGAVRECIGNVKLFTRDELISELERVNEGASEAVIALA